MIRLLEHIEGHLSDYISARSSSSAHLLVSTSPSNDQMKIFWLADSMAFPTSQAFNIHQAFSSFTRRSSFRSRFRNERQFTMDSPISKVISIEHLDRVWTSTGRLKDHLDSLVANPWPSSGIGFEPWFWLLTSGLDLGFPLFWTLPRGPGNGTIVAKEFGKRVYSRFQ